jgi:hypothetical protein
LLVAVKQLVLVAGGRRPHGLNHTAVGRLERRRPTSVRLLMMRWSKSQDPDSPGVFRRDLAFYEFVSTLCGATPEQVGKAFAEGSTATTPRQAAGEILGAGYAGLCVMADCLMEGRTQRFYKQMTPEKALAASLWFADSLLAWLPGVRAGGARSTLSDEFPIGDPAKEAKTQIEHDELELALLGVGMMLGEKRARDLRFVRQFEGLNPNAVLNTALVADAWARCTRVMFFLIDPDGYKEWGTVPNR